MFIQNIGIEIDIKNSMLYGNIYTTAGTYSGVGVSGQMPSMLLNYECDESILFQTVNLYADLTRQTINISSNNICPQGIHIGGVILTSNGCDCEVFAFLQREDKCLEYKRAFDSSFNISYRDISETINICADGSEFESAYNCEFTIEDTCVENNNGDLWLRDGDTLPLPNGDGNLL